MSEPPVVLMIEDEADVRLALTVLLERANLRPIQAEDGRSGLRKLHDERPDCVVLDVSLPDLDGWQVLERIRDLSDIPVLMLTARHLESEKVRGLQAGADDYLTKPFGNQEFIARVQALLRRSRPAESASAYTDGLLTIDPAEHRVSVDGTPVELTPIEFRVLHALVSAAPQVIEPVRMLELAWSDPTGTGPDRVKYVVHRLRRKLGFEHAEAGPIQAVRGVGYRYVRPG